MIRLMILFFLSNILITVCLVFGCWIEPIESVILATRVPYSLNDTICNPSWPLHIVYHPQGGFANSFRALRGLITLALMFNATVTSESYSCLWSVATWNKYCSVMDESLSCLCSGKAYWFPHIQNLQTMKQEMSISFSSMMIFLMGE